MVLCPAVNLRELSHDGGQVRILINVWLLWGAFSSSMRFFPLNADICKHVVLLVYVNVSEHTTDNQKGQECLLWWFLLVGNMTTSNKVKKHKSDGWFNTWLWPETTPDVTKISLLNKLSFLMYVLTILSINNFMSAYFMYEVLKVAKSEITCKGIGLAGSAGPMNHKNNVF